jgi:hypothetical protein
MHADGTRDAPLNPIVAHVIDLLDGAGVDPDDVIQVDIAEGAAWVWKVVWASPPGRYRQPAWLSVNGKCHWNGPPPVVRRRTRYDLRELEQAARTACLTQVSG